MALSTEMPWSDGEHRMHTLMKVPEGENPTSEFLSPHAGYMTMQSPIVAIGVLDKDKRPWTTIWGGEMGFSRPLGDNLIGIRNDVDIKFDPVVEALKNAEFGKGMNKGMMISGLPIDLAHRRRVKLFGRVVGGKLSEAKEAPFGDMQLVINIEQSMGNCPKYLNKKEIHPAIPEPELIASGPSLTDEGLALLNKADVFFMTSSNGDIDMDTNHRGGPPGFIRALSNNVIAYPEYSGNRLYQSLGNLISTPAVGIVVPDFDTGDVLYITGTTEILMGADAAALLPRTNLAVKITLVDTRLVRKGLSFHGFAGELSPYNPPVRLLVSEGNIAAAFESKPEGTATLIDKEELSPSVARYRFRASHPVKYKPGQWVALDFSEELDIGYSHMREDDPTSLNDDFIRTFTISSHPGDLPENEFEITARLHGPVTEFLNRQRLSSRRTLEVMLRGFGGDFELHIPQDQGILPFIAGGVGITPLLGQLKELDVGKVRLIWIIRAEDLDFVRDTFKKYPALSKGTTLFLTGGSKSSKTEHQVDGISELGVNVRIGRPGQSKDIIDAAPEAITWHLCAGQPLRKQLLEWLKDKKVVFENFDY